MKADMKYILSIFFALIIALPLPAHAEDKPADIFVSDAILKQNQPTLDRVAAYLSRLTTIKSDFTQVAPDGSLASGKFFLQRPGKMRWQYNPPTPILMVADGSELVFYDYQLEQVSHIPLDGSLVSFLAQEVIRFDGDVGVTHYESAAKVIRIEVAQRKKPTEGKLMLEFSDVPLALRSMEITDASGQVTSVALTNASFGGALDPKLFVFKDPRKGRPKT